MREGEREREMHGERVRGKKGGIRGEEGVEERG